MKTKSPALPATLPCPFCGKKPRFTFIPASMAKPELDGAFYSLTCHRPSNLCPGQPTAHGDTKAEAIAAWNTRAPSPKETLALAACRSIRFAGHQAVRHGGEYSLNDLMAADRLAGEALGELKPAKKGGAS